MASFTMAQGCEGTVVRGRSLSKGWVPRCIFPYAVHFVHEILGSPGIGTYLRPGTGHAGTDAYVYPGSCARSAAFNLHTHDLHHRLTWTCAPDRISSDCISDCISSCPYHLLPSGLRSPRYILLIVVCSIVPGQGGPLHRHPVGVCRAYLRHPRTGLLAVVFYHMQCVLRAYAQQNLHCITLAGGAA